MVLGRRVGLLVQFEIMGGMMRTQAAQMETTVRCKSVKPVTGGLARKARTKTSQSLQFHKKGLFKVPNWLQSATQVRKR